MTTKNILTWRIAVSDVDTKTNTIKIDGQEHDLGFALKFLLPAYFSTFDSKTIQSNNTFNAVEPLVAAGIKVSNFLPMAAEAHRDLTYRRQAEAREAIRQAEQQAIRFAELNKTKEQVAREQLEAEARKKRLREQSELIRSAGSSLKASRASQMLANIESINLLDD
ncbi:hypothetical protein ACUN4K_14880 [Hafnia alvei]|uniref:hypothetical protein n=1 Tax=Hafnia alvei TaxID=569 RepID=UPI00404624E2